MAGELESLCTVFRSEKREGLYLYVRRELELDELPAELVKSVSPLTVVMDLDLASRERLAVADIDAVRSAVREQGFFLQMPPSTLDPTS